MVANLSSKKSVLNHFLRELRDVEIQKDKRRFERNLEKAGALAAYELSKQLTYIDQETTTSLGQAKTALIKDKIVIATILRAGLPMQKGVASIFEEAELAFIAAGRKPETGHGVEIDLAYTASPDLTGKILIIADTMLATGSSILDSYNALRKYGMPSRLFIICAIASQPGIEFVEKNIPGAGIIAAAVDPGLNDKFYIVPGLGDAGDLLYGEKL
jgi:uracil phosphoribosyltransferase